MSKRIPNLVATGFSLLLALSLSSSFYLQYKLEQSLDIVRNLEFLMAKTRGSVREVKVSQLERAQKLSLLVLSGNRLERPIDPQLIAQLAQAIQLNIREARKATQDPVLSAALGRLAQHEQDVELQVQQLLQYWFKGEEEQALRLYQEGYLPALSQSLSLAKNALDLSFVEVKRYSENATIEAVQTQSFARTTILFCSLVGLIAALILARMVSRIVRDSQRAAQENQDMIAYSMDVICVFDEQGRFVRVTDACQRIWGYSAAELIGRSCMDLVIEEDVEKTLEASAAILSGNPTRSFQNRHRRKDGSIVSLMWSARWLEPQQQTFCVARDVTENDRVQQALQYSEERTRLIVATAQDAFVGMDEQGNITDWNPKAEQLFGWSYQQVIGRPLHELIIPEQFRQRHLQGLQRYLQTGEGPVLNKRLELMALNRAGEQLPVEFTISPIRLHDSVLFCAFLHDISERMQSEQELHQAKELAEAANRAKSEFLANMSHEIRTPMNGVLGTLSLLLETSLTDTQRELARLAYASGESLLAIINDILDFSKIEAGKLSIETIGFNLLWIVEEVASIVAPKASEKKLDVIVSYPETVPRTLVGDPGRIRQILINLVNNALKFTEKGQVLISVELIQRDDQQVSLLLSVEDSGIGIESSKLGQLFEKFTQADSSTTRRYGGTGLGLAISKQLVELMGGKIGASSELGKGSRFWFQLNLPMQSGAVEESVPSQMDLQGVRVLVVDDNATNRRVLQEQLSSWRLRNDSVDSAEAALTALNQARIEGDPYQIAILDYQMPEVDGAMLGRQIKASPALSDTELLMLTSLGQHELGQELLQQGFSAYLMKPVRQSELLGHLSRVWLNHLQQQPVSSTRPTPIPEIATASSPLSVQFSGARVLLAEDNSINQVVGSMMLKNLGCEVDIAADGQQAIAKVLSHSYQIIFMDCEMPVMDGFEATSEIRHLGLTLPIIAVTAQAMQGDRERCLAAGMNDYISKPVQAESFAKALERWLPQDSAKVAPLSQASQAAETLPVVSVERLTELQQVIGSANKAALVALFNSFVQDMPIWLQALEQAMSNQDLSGIARFSHKLVGASSTLGLARLAAVAEWLQQQARQGRLPPSIELQSLTGHYHEALAELRQQGILPDLEH